MEYFNLLNFKKEPFSNSPAPEFLFASPQYSTCLQMLELAIRLRRGLNIVIGAVGTGKTTLCRKLIQNLSAPVAGDSLEIETYLLLDPALASRLEFVKTVAGIVGINDVNPDEDEWHLKEKFKKFLFEKGVDEQKIIVLIIDEGQKIPDDCLEILREFLNYETNNSKLLQIVIFAQPEIDQSLIARANLLDRVNYLCRLEPLSFGQMKAMIEHRIAVARQEPIHQSLLTQGGLLAVYLATKGYPRRVVSLCHQVVLMMIIRNKDKAGWFLVRGCISAMHRSKARRVTWATVSLLITACLVFFSVFYWSGQTVFGTQPQREIALSGGDGQKEYSFSVSRSSGNEYHQSLPDTLGTITLKKGMTVWHALENIYGDSGAQVKKQFMEANPQIKDIHIIVEGAVIQMPAMPAAANPMRKDTIIISLENSKEMETLYQSFIQKKELDKMPRVLFLSTWNQKEGKQFVIALDKRYASLDEANEAVRRLSPEFAVTAQVLSQWDEGTINFNNRFFRN